MPNNIYIKAIIGIIFFLLLIGTQSCSQLRQARLGPQAIKAEEDLQHEYDGFNKLPDSTLIKSGKYSKQQSVTLEYHYITTKNIKEIHDFYLNEAIMNGWVLVKENDQNIMFQKDNYKLSIGYNIKKDNFYLLFYWEGTKAPLGYGKNN